MSLESLAVTFWIASVDSALALLLHVAEADEMGRLLAGAAWFCVSLGLACLSAAALLREVGR